MGREGRGEEETERNWEVELEMAAGIGRAAAQVDNCFLSPSACVEAVADTAQETS